MRLKNVGLVLVGSVAVNGAVAACVAAGASGPGESRIADAAAAILDAVTGSVRDASAQATPETAEEACDKSYACATETCLYAEHEYPGMSISALSSVRAIGHSVQGTGIPGYDHHLVVPAVAEGKVAAFCGMTPTPGFDRVTFVR